MKNFVKSFLIKILGDMSERYLTGEKRKYFIFMFIQVLPI